MSKKTARKILGMKKWKWMKDLLNVRLGVEQADSIWKATERRLDEYLTRYADISKGEHMHTDSRIFPSAAVYLSMKEAVGKEEALELMDLYSDHLTKGMAAMLRKMMLIPGMRNLFVKVWDPLAKKMFGPECGFSNRFYENKEGEYRMDVTACPYNKYYTEIGCPEITNVSCTNDDRMYGNLPGIEFSRTQTLGRGGECCDFSLKKTDIMYKSNISDERWIAYDIPGNIGWIAYFIGFGKLIANGNYKAAAVTAVPAALMATGICELVSERIAGLDRKLPIERLQRGFGALTVGGATGIAAGLAAGKGLKNKALMSSGAALCTVFSTLIMKTFKRA